MDHDLIALCWALLGYRSWHAIVFTLHVFCSSNTAHILTTPFFIATQWLSSNTLTQINSPMPSIRVMMPNHPGNIPSNMSLLLQIIIIIRALSDKDILIGWHGFRIILKRIIIDTKDGSCSGLLGKVLTGQLEVTVSLFSVYCCILKVTWLHLTLKETVFNINFVVFFMGCN